MRTLDRNKRVLYLCKHYVDGKIRKYKEPVKVWDNYEPMHSDNDMLVLGEVYPKYLRIKRDNLDKNLYEPGDRAYIYVSPPNTHDVLCKTADYEVDNEPLDTINQLDVRLKRLSGK